MTYFLRNLLIFVLVTTFLGCESKNSYNINSDKAIADMSVRIEELNSDLNTLKEELAAVKKVLDDKDIDTDLRNSIRTEIHEGEKHRRDIEQWLAYLKIQRKERYQSLLDRQKNKTLDVDQVNKEVKAYFLHKKLKPIDKKWKNRYKTAIEL